MIATARRPRLRPEEAPGLGGRGDRKRCAHCRRVKPLEQFYKHDKTKDGRGSWCRTCHRIRKVEVRQTEEYRAWNAEYSARPEVRQKKRLSNTARLEKRRPQQQAYRRTVRGRLRKGIRDARFDLTRAKSERGRERILARMAAYEAELARLDASLDGEAPAGRGDAGRATAHTTSTGGH